MQRADSDDSPVSSPSRPVGIRGLRALAAKSAQPTAAAPPAPSTTFADAVAPAPGDGFSAEERLWWWRQLGRVLRIQRWWRRRSATRRVRLAIGEQRAAWADDYRDECAATVQRAWAAFCAKRLAKKLARS